MSAADHKTHFDVLPNLVHFRPSLGKISMFQSTNALQMYLIKKKEKKHPIKKDHVQTSKLPAAYICTYLRRHFFRSKTI